MFFFCSSNLPTANKPLVPPPPSDLRVRADQQLPDQLLESLRQACIGNVLLLLVELAYREQAVGPPAPERSPRPGGPAAAGSAAGEPAPGLHRECSSFARRTCLPRTSRWSART